MMKLFIWADPYRVPYGSAMVFAIAKNEAHARKIVEGAPRYSYCKFRNNNATGGGIELKEPTRIVDLPCAEWHEWEE
jgi:hypothetical protein